MKYTYLSWSTKISCTKLLGTANTMTSCIRKASPRASGNHTTRFSSSLNKINTIGACFAILPVFVCGNKCNRSDYLWRSSSIRESGDTLLRRFKHSKAVPDKRSALWTITVLLAGYWDVTLLLSATSPLEWGWPG